MAWKILDCAEATCVKNNETVQADPDIAGIGVGIAQSVLPLSFTLTIPQIIVGFLSTTCLAFLVAFTVLFLHHFDEIINFFRRHFTKKISTYTQNEDAQHHAGPYWRSVTFWGQVLSKNLLALSDTQLLTGLAIQFTAMIKHCAMSVYHFRIVVDLAFLTTVTHLLTVVALRDYFVEYRWINLPRIFFMLANLALLGYTSFVAYSYDLAHLQLSDSLACFFQQDRPPFTAAFGGKWAALLVGAIGGHAAVIAAMYWLKEPTDDKKGRWYYYVWYGGALIRTWVVAPAYAIYGVYMATDGLSQTQALGEPPSGVIVNGNESAWNFGQFLPVLLLALPIFAGWESFWEEKDENRDTRFGRRSLRKSRNTLGMNSFELSHQKFIAKYGGHSRDPSREEQRIESAGHSPIGTPRIRAQTSPPIRPISTGILAPSPSLGSDTLLSVPPPTASPNLGPNFSRPTPPRPSRSPSRTRTGTT